MLFLLPLELVPVAVAAGIVLGSVVEHAEGGSGWNECSAAS